MTEQNRSTSRKSVSVPGDLFLKIITQHQLASEALPDCHGDIHREIVDEMRACAVSEIGLTVGELDALIDFHDQNDAGAEAMGYIKASEYHTNRSKHFKALRDALPEAPK